MKDSRGADVLVGSKVVYFTRFSSSMSYHAGTVLSLVQRESWGQTEDLAKVQIDDERDSWSDKDKVRTVTGCNLVVVTGLPEVSGS